MKAVFRKKRRISGVGERTHVSGGTLLHASSSSDSFAWNEVDSVKASGFGLLPVRVSCLKQFGVDRR